MSEMFHCQSAARGYRSTSHIIWVLTNLPVFNDTARGEETGRYMLDLMKLV